MVLINPLRAISTLCQRANTLFVNINTNHVDGLQIEKNEIFLGKYHYEQLQRNVFNPGQLRITGNCV